MKTFHKALAGAMFSALASTALAQATVGVSWSNFQEERWKTDEAAIKAQLAKLGAKYISADAGGSPEKQISDVDSLLAKGATSLIILAMDKDAIVPALAKAKQRKVPVVAYDRLIEQPGVFYITFDNKEVGRLQAKAVLAAKASGLRPRAVCAAATEDLTVGGGLRGLRTNEAASTACALPRGERSGRSRQVPSRRPGPHFEPASVRRVHLAGAPGPRPGA
ncbi:MAG: substrate-binding domain-containing protein, partial [Rhizobacter sp.]